MSAFVLDASVAVNWLLDDELDPKTAIVMARTAQDRALVPQLWHLEVRNALLIAERRGRITANGLEERRYALRRLLVSTDTTPDLEGAFALARTHGLTFYDALYLELAQRRHAALATLDTALGRAAVAAGTALV